MSRRPRFWLVRAFKLGQVWVQEQEESVRTYGLLELLKIFMGLRLFAPIASSLHSRQCLKDRPKAVAVGRRHVMRWPSSLGGVGGALHMPSGAARVLLDKQFQGA